MMRLKYSSSSGNVLSRLFVWTKFFPALTLLLFTSCDKESDLGIDLQPEGDLIGLFTNDTTSLVTYTVREDSIRTDEAPTVVVGSYVDPVFGKSTCGLYSQFSIPNNQININFGASAVLDSAVLSLAYQFDYYGDTTDIQTWKVYQLTDDIYRDSTYYSNKVKAYYPADVGSITFQPKPRTKVAVGGDTLSAHIRIPINNSFAQQIFSQSGTSNMANNAAFLQYMKGFYLAPSNPGQSVGDGALIYLKLSDTLTKFTLYYHTASDTSEFDFVVNSQSAYYSYYEHDYSNAPGILAQLNSPGVGGWNENYIQANAGVKTKVEFPFLQNYNGLGFPIALNKAELVIKGDPTQATSDLPLNTRFLLTYIDSAGSERLLPDLFESGEYFGGTLNTTTNEYRINIARYLQQVLQGELPNNGIYIKEIFAAENGRRSVIGSGDASSSYRMYLRFTYTKIN